MTFKQLFEDSDKEYAAAAADHAAGGPAKRQKELAKEGKKVRTSIGEVSVYQKVTAYRVNLEINGHDAQMDTDSDTINYDPTGKLTSLYARTEWFNMSDIFSSSDIKKIHQAIKSL